MRWSVEVKEAAIEHLRWFGKKTARLLLEEAITILGDNPLAESKQLKTLRPNRVAQKELRLWGKYRILFSVDEEDHVITIILVGEKRGNKLLVMGEEFNEHHEGNSTE